jgi:hypothetical protein
VAISGAAVTAPLLPLFVKLAGKTAVVVGGGHMAALRVRHLAEASARVVALGEANVPAECAHLPGTLVIGAVAGLSLTPSQPLAAPSQAASRSA